MRSYLLLLAALTGIWSTAAISAETPVPGEVAPDITLPVLSGEETRRLSALRGKVVLVDFWASWCGPCKVSLPVLSELNSEFSDRGFEVMAVNVDKDPAKAIKFLKRTPVTYQSLHDAEGETPKLLNIKAMPTSLLVDREGIIRMVHPGFRPGDETLLREEILKLL